ncbi:DUF4383 domain-containing protein [Actinokineospora spheciospongiae]|nr:DUF4383 domain-containing protein [Actinokineospora spheciospongiae]
MDERQGDGRHERAAAPRSPARWLCAALGAVLLVLGVVGLVQSGLDGFASTPASTAEGTVGGLGGSTLLNLVHIGLGLLALLAALRKAARIAGLFGCLVFTALLAYDIVALIDNAPGEPAGVHTPILVVHGVGLLASIAIAWLEGRADGDYAGDRADRGTNKDIPRHAD